MLSNADFKRELEKTLDVLKRCDQHFGAEALMNAALHMADVVRPAPLAAAVASKIDDLKLLIEALGDESEI